MLEQASALAWEQPSVDTPSQAWRSSAWSSSLKAAE